jgi:hypothetical protein
LVLEVSAGWVNPSSRGLCGGDALLLSTGAGNLERLQAPEGTAETRTDGSDGLLVVGEARDVGAVFEVAQVPDLEAAVVRACREPNQESS